MEIRAATLEDVDRIRELMVASMSVLGAGFYTAEEAEGAAKYLTVPDLDLIEDGTLYVAVVAETRQFTSEQGLSLRTPSPTVPPSARAEKSTFSELSPRLQGEPSPEIIVGVGGWSSRIKLFTGSEEQEGLVGRLDPERDPARIRAFFVDPAYARRGIARRLYEACASAAKAAGFRSFSLMATLPGVPLYRALGFGDERPTRVPLPDGTRLPCVEMRRGT